MKRYAFLLLLCHGCSDRNATYPYMPIPDAAVFDAKTGSGGGGAANGAGGAPGTGGATSLDGGRRDASVDAAMSACVVTQVDSCPNPEPSFKSDVIPIFEAKCNGCHSGADANGPWPLTNLKDIVDWKVLVVEDIEECTMPPPGMGTRLTAGENQTILGWLACNAPNN